VPGRVAVGPQIFLKPRDPRAAQVVRLDRLLAVEELLDREPRVRAGLVQADGPVPDGDHEPGLAPKLVMLGIR
jgi:hypothetical protein